MEVEGDSNIVIGSLRALIERLRDPDGDAFLCLTKEEQLSLGKYEGVYDFAEIFSEYLDAIKANTTITEIEIKGYLGAEKSGIFPIVNPLLRYLPRRKSLRFELPEAESDEDRYFAEEPPVQRFLFKDAASFTTVKIVDMGSSDTHGAVLELHPDLHVFEYTNRHWPGANGLICRSLLSLTFPSQLREFSVLDDVQRSRENWIFGGEGPFREPDLTRLVDMVQVSSLVKLSLERVRFATDEESSRFARGLAVSPVKDLSLLLFAPNAGIYRHIVNALSEMPHLETLKAGFALDEWGEATKRVGSFSIPVGGIVRGASNLKSLKIGQCWKPWDEVQYSVVIWPWQFKHHHVG